MNSYKTAKDVCSNKIYYIDGLASVKQAVEMMKENKVDALIIQKRNERDANGIVVISDIIKKVVVSDLKLEEVSVYEIMSKPVISIPANLNAKYVPRYLINAKIKIAPVEENGIYVGLIKLGDSVLNSI